MKNEFDRYYSDLALKEAEKALNEHTYPIGAVIVDDENHIISIGRNQVHPNMDATAHAEIEAIRNAGQYIWDAKVKGKKLTIYTSLEPCPMCTGAILFANIKKVVWLLDDDKGFGGYRKIKDSRIFDERFNKVEMMGEPYNDLKEKQLLLLERWGEHPNHVRNLRKNVTN